MTTYEVEAVCTVRHLNAWERGETREVTIEANNPWLAARQMAKDIYANQHLVKISDDPLEYANQEFVFQVREQVPAYVDEGATQSFYVHNCYDGGTLDTAIVKAPDAEAAAKRFLQAGGATKAAEVVAGVPIQGSRFTAEVDGRVYELIVEAVAQDGEGPGATVPFPSVSTPPAPDPCLLVTCRFYRGTPGSIDVTAPCWVSHTNWDPGVVEDSGLTWTDAPTEAALLTMARLQYDHIQATEEYPVDATNDPTVVYRDVFDDSLILDLPVHDGLVWARVTVTA